MHEWAVKRCLSCLQYQLEEGKERIVTALVVSIDAMVAENDLNLNNLHPKSSTVSLLDWNPVRGVRHDQESIVIWANHQDDGPANSHKPQDNGAL